MRLLVKHIHYTASLSRCLSVCPCSFFRLIGNNDDDADDNTVNDQDDVDDDGYHEYY